MRLTQARGVRVCQNGVRGVGLKGAPEAFGPRDGHHMVVARPTYILQVSSCPQIRAPYSKRCSLTAYLRRRGDSSIHPCGRCAALGCLPLVSPRLYVTSAATHLSTRSLPDYLPLPHLPGLEVYLRLVNPGARSSCQQRRRDRANGGQCRGFKQGGRRTSRATHAPP